MVVIGGKRAQLEIKKMVGRRHIEWFLVSGRGEHERMGGSSVVLGALDGSMRGDDGNTKCDQYGGVCGGVMLGDYLLGLLRGRSMQGVVVAGFYGH